MGPQNGEKVDHKFFSGLKFLKNTEDQVRTYSAPVAAEA